MKKYFSIFLSWDDPCDVESWQNVDNGVICGPCKALINNMGTFKTCKAYCETEGLSCVAAWEEKNDSCEIDSAKTCDFDFSSISTSDAICECSVSGKLS